VFEEKYQHVRLALNDPLLAAAACLGLLALGIGSRSAP
jgi:hypothetical protein